MKADIHPKSRKVLFIDATSKDQFLIDSTAHTTTRAISDLDGLEYDAFSIEISSATHPFYTGIEKNLDTTGRVDRFKKKMEKKVAEVSTVK